MFVSKTNTLLMEFGQNRMEIELNMILQEHEGYQAANQEADEKLDQVLSFCKDKPELRRPIDELVSTCTHVGSLYGAVAYQLGFEDAIKIVAELHEIGKEK